MPVEVPTATPGPALRPGARFERVRLDGGSWVDVCRGWLAGADELYRAVAVDARWEQGRVFRYDRWVGEPRLSSWCRPGRDAPHPVLADLHRAIQHRVGVRFDGVALAFYRDGRDGVAFHRDRELRWLDDTVIGVLTLGATRPFLLRPRANRYAHDAPDHGATHDLAPAGGDLLIMGGRCQADWEHAVPKVHRPIGGRISLQWRWTARRGRPERGAGYRAPRTYSR
jgi:alkylated DNA repair dioxygenase AlkB